MTKLELADKHERFAKQFEDLGKMLFFLGIILYAGVCVLVPSVTLITLLLFLFVVIMTLSVVMLVAHHMYQISTETLRTTD